MGDYHHRLLSVEELACLRDGTGSPEYRACLLAIQDLAVKRTALGDAWTSWTIYTSSIWATEAGSAAKWAAFEQAARAAVEAENTARRSGPMPPPGWNSVWRFGIQGADGNWHPAPLGPTEYE